MGLAERLSLLTRQCPRALAVRPRIAHRRRTGFTAGRPALDRMEPFPARGRPVAGGEWSAPTHLSWVAGVCPVEPHTEVADHERVYDGSRWAGRARAFDPAGGGSRR